MQFHSFHDVQAHLDRLGLFHMDFGLARMENALTRLGFPLRSPGAGVSRPAASPVVQIVGTNGKGSTASFLSSLLQSHGLRTGLFTSPHLARVTERIRMNGRILPEGEWHGLAEKVYRAAPDLTYFEFLTMLALLAFQKNKADAILLEAGLGGRYDATSAVRVDVVCFTPIDLDHQQYLGPDYVSIAREKAHAMPVGGIAFSAPQREEVRAVLQSMANERLCSLTFAPDVPAMKAPLPQLGLNGPHQRLNAGLALAVWRHLAERYGWTICEEAERRGLEEAFIPGRMQWIPATEEHPALLLDGAHNPHGFTALTAALAERGISPDAIVFTCMADKDTQGLIAAVRALAGERLPVLVPRMQAHPRASGAQELASRIGGRAQASPDVFAALREAGRYVSHKNGVILLCGSLYLLGEFFDRYPQFLETPSAAC